MNLSALDDWAASDWNNGIQLDQLGELESLSVRTRHTTYEIVITSPSAGEVLVRGGSRFPTFTPVRVCGSTLGGNLLKLSGIYPGLRIEFQHENRRILTSTVLSLELGGPAREH